ncbi:MAG: HAMP domain-containing histidine kinase [Thermoproteota archaeon]|nr:HAMP domain-containing histidine kinase [Thermoproteota archaeon]
MLPESNSKKKKGFTTEDLLTLKTGELIAKTQELTEANESIQHLNDNLRANIEEVKRTKEHLLDSENSLLLANNKLIEANDRLAKMNKELAIINRELAIVNEKMKQYSIRQREFIDMAAHELRTPVQAIAGYSELLLSEPHVNLEYAEPINRNAERLQMIISNILDMSKIDNNTLTLYKEQFDLIHLISSVVDDARNQITRDKKNITILYDIAISTKEDGVKGGRGVVVNGDRERITQVVSNIIDNAIRFTREGTISITVEGKMGNNSSSGSDSGFISSNKNSIDKSLEEIVVKVKDSGEGLDSQAYKKLFSKFFSTSGTGGTGLGLYISKAIIEAHGGRVWAENNQGNKGAIFSFSLPLK